MSSRTRKVAALLAALSVSCVLADVYMQAPRGSNDRNCERNANRNNGNRLFDSQNNAAGGYACPRAVGDESMQPESGEARMGQHTQNKRTYYYENSILPIEWTNQHGCGDNSIVQCEVVLQYACEDTLDPMVDNFWPWTQGKNINNPDTAGEKHFRFRSRVAAPRDGVPRDSNDAATDTIPDTLEAAIPSSVETRRFGMHESFDTYQLCQHTERNKGLYTADQRMRREDQRGTRQNPNGNRRGLECPEERDYYPWWQPSPWIDIAVMTNDALDTVCLAPGDACSPRCAFYVANSFNTAEKCYCDANHETGTVNDKLNNQEWTRRRWHNNKEACEAAGFSWYCVSLSDHLTGLHPPACVKTQYSRVNHLGNTMSAATAEGVTSLESTNVPASRRERVLRALPHSANPNRFIWQIPEIPTASSEWSEEIESDYLSCTLRIRYNISTGDFPKWPDAALAEDSPFLGKMVTSANNSRFEGDPRTPLFQDPYVYIGPGGQTDAANSANDAFVSLAVNTNQYGRTFQDRSYVFSIKKVPEGTGVQQYDASADSPMVLTGLLNTDLNNNGIIYNLGVRGKRGNIVQTFPSTEYSFIPEQVIGEKTDWIHFQWTGSDYNPRRGCNDGDGGPGDANLFTDNANNHNARSDRNNICLVLTEAHNQPREYAGYDPEAMATATYAERRNIAKQTILDHAFCKDASNSVTDDQCYDMIMRLCFLNQEDDLGSLFLRSNRRCLTQEQLNAINDRNLREQHPLNCAKLNAKPFPYFDGGLVPLKKGGIYPFFSSRNNNFSNRDQTGIICVNGDGVNCMTQFYVPALRTLQDKNDIAGATPTLFRSFCNDDQNNGIAANNNGAASCIGNTRSNDVLGSESFAVEQGDNDKSGDGNRRSCEEFTNLFKNPSVEEQIGLAVGLLFVGLFTSWVGYYAYNRYRAVNPEDSKYKGNKRWTKETRENQML